MENNANKMSLLEMPELADVIASTPAVEHRAGVALFQAGTPCTTLPMLVSGKARVHARDENDQQVTLYYLESGDICPISLSVLLQNGSYPASATADTDAQVRYLPGAELIATINSSPKVFRTFLDTFANGLNDASQIARQLNNVDTRITSPGNSARQSVRR